MRHPVQSESQSQVPSLESSDHTFACSRVLEGSDQCLFLLKALLVPLGCGTKEFWRSALRQSPDARRRLQPTIALEPADDRGGLEAPIQKRISIWNVVHLGMRVIHGLWNAFRHLTLHMKSRTD